MLTITYDPNIPQPKNVLTALLRVVTTAVRNRRNSSTARAATALVYSQTRLLSRRGCFRGPCFCGGVRLNSKPFRRVQVE